jgi:signal transduction histidine kinase
VTRTRVGINIRVFTLAATIGLAGANQTLPGVLGGYLVLCAIAAISSVPHQRQVLYRAGPVVEGALVGLTLGVTGVANQPLGMYLLAPALLAGLVGGPITVSATFLAELCAIVTLPIVRLEPQLLAEAVRSMLPWLLTAIGIGLLGSWIRRLGWPSVDEDHERYQAAYVLLDQLRVVSRRLSSGLDPVALSITLLDDCLDGFPDDRGAVLIRTEGGVFTSLAQTDLMGLGAAAVTYPMVVKCWESGVATGGTATGSPAVGSPEGVSGGTATESTERVRWTLPLRVGPRMVAVLALEVAETFELERRNKIQALLDERALPLDTALLFDEVRTLATVEERRRVAREIHDGIAQELASLGYVVDDLAARARFLPDLEHDLKALRGELTRVITELRLSIFDLRSEVQPTTGLGGALSDYVRQVGAGSSLTVHLELDETTIRLPVDAETELLRIAQEAITNARKHANAQHLWVSCSVDPPHATLRVEDDGGGLGAPRADSFGLEVMRERAERIGARLSVRNRAGGGTTVEVSLGPVPARG